MTLIADTLNCHTVGAEINATLLLDLSQQVVDQDDVEVFTAQMCVAVGGLDLKHALLHLQDRNIKCPSSKIVDSNNG